MKRHSVIGIVLISISILIVAGYLLWRDSAAREQEAAKQALASSNMRTLLLGLHMFIGAHGGQWPDGLNQIENYIGGRAALMQCMKNPLTGDDPGYEYVKPVGREIDFGHCVVIYQLRNGQRDLGVPVGYADTTTRQYEPPHLPKDLTNDNLALPASRSDEAALQGRWRIISCKRNGRDYTARASDELTFAEDRWSGTILDLRATDNALFQLSSQKTPKEINWVVVAVEPVAAARKLTSIYAMDGEKLRIATPLARNAGKPIDFESRENDNVEVLTLERVKSTRE